MYGYSFQNWIVFFQFQSFGRILSIFRCDITRSSRHTAVFVFSTFQYNLYSITFCFLCHICISSIFLADNFNVFPIAIPLSYCIFQSCIQAFFINDAQAVCTNAQANPAVLLYIIEFFIKQVHIKCSFGSSLSLFYSFILLLISNRAQSKHFYC